MTTPEFSVIIPTYNRKPMLLRVLRALESQRDAPGFEVILVDDGSTDGTAEMIASGDFALELTYLQQPNRGPATARNRGIDRAQAEVIAFLGDDTIPGPDWLAAHAHAQHSQPGGAVLGYTSWHEDIPLTPFLDHINEKGLQFGYGLIANPDDVPFNFFYTSNISIARSALGEDRFDPGFPYPAWEDTELARRLTNQGMRIRYAPNARVFHHHQLDYDAFARRQYMVGVASRVMLKRHPDLAVFLGYGPEGPSPMPHPALTSICDWLARWTQRTMRLPRLWDLALRRHYVRGQRSAELSNPDTSRNMAADSRTRVP